MQKFKPSSAYHCLMGKEIVDRCTTMKSTMLRKFILFFMVGMGGISGYSMTLREALQRAWEKHPTVQRAHMNLQRSQLLFKANQASLKSQFRLTLTPLSFSAGQRFDERFSTWYTNSTYQSVVNFRVTQPILWTDGTLTFQSHLNWRNSNTENPNGTVKWTGFGQTTNISFSQPLFTYNRQKMRREQLQNSIKRDHLNYSLQKLTVERDITSRFYDLYRQANSVKIAKENYEAAQETYRIISSKVAGDLLAKAELYQAEVTLANARSSLYSVENQYLIAHDRFKRDLELPPDDTFSLEVDTTVREIAVDLPHATDHALKVRQEIQTRKLDIRQSEFSLITTKAENKFKGTLTLSMGLSSQKEQITTLFSDMTRTPEAALTLEIPLYDWGSKKAKVEAEEISKQLSELDFELQKRDIIYSLRQVVISLNNAYAQVEIAQLSLMNAQRTYDIYLERYKNGELTSLQIQQRQIQLAEQKSKVINSIIAYKIELLNLKVQSLWDFENNTPYINVFSEL